MHSFKRISFLTSLFFISILTFGQSYLHTDGKNIVDGNGDNFLIRSIGTGNWMLMEGYMMKSSGDAGAGTQHEFKAKLIETIGQEKTDSFFTVWLNNHMREIDVDSLASWGFNSIRVAMHYKWFTLPIEEEPVAGEQTWLDTGFDILDSLLKWCEKNEMYLILDMHGAPGGQGANADISDYDPSKPSLWEDIKNEDKLVALWMKLAEKYSEEPWIGGYDLINETNWSFPTNNNIQLRNLFLRLTDSIRQVDTNHILFIEGNSWANDFSMLFPPWDDNMVYSPHKYWNFNDQGSVQWVINYRNQYNVPIWLGETGENSNTWYTNAIKLFEKNNIGWSWWPVKKGGINNPLRVNFNEDYYHLLDYWKGTKPKPSEEDAFQAVLTLAENHKLENCVFQKDVIDAMFRQPYTTELKPYAIYNPLDYIYATDYDLGRNNYAYFDVDTGNYSSAGTFTPWNTGYEYRSDGVDIEACTDSDNSNGYNVGWINAGEWMVYSLESDSAAILDCTFRSASGGSGGYIQLEANGELISDEIFLPATGSWSTWESTLAKDILLPGGDIKLKVKFPFGGVNLSYLQFSNPRSPNSTVFSTLYIETAENENEFYLHLTDSISAEQIIAEDFTFYINNEQAQINSVTLSEESNRILIFKVEDLLLYGQSLKLSYSGSSITSNGIPMQNYEMRRISNKQSKHFTIPTRIQAEDFTVNNGLALEECEDAGGGNNTGYADYGDYLEYLVYVKEATNYNINFRVALGAGGAQIALYYKEDDNYILLKNVNFTSTGGWQTWETQTTNVELPEGKYIFRIFIKSGAHNLNWFQFFKATGIESKGIEDKIMLYPNPAHSHIQIEFPSSVSLIEKDIEIYDLNGSLIHKEETKENRLKIDVSNFEQGLYLINVKAENYQSIQKFIIK